MKTIRERAEQFSKDWIPEEEWDKESYIKYGYIAGAEDQEVLSKEIIEVHVMGGCAYSDDPRIKIIDHDIKD